MRLYDKVIQMCGTQDFMKGLNYQANKVNLYKKNIDNFERNFEFKVTSERSERIYDVDISVYNDDKEIEDIYCTCPQFEKMDTCKHVAACLLKYEDILFGDDDVNLEMDFGKQILNSFYSENKHIIKKKLNLEVNIDLEHSYYYDDYWTINYKVGLDKMYTLNTKLRNFIRSYKNKEKYKLTPKFTYDPDEYYFDKIDKGILDYNVRLFQGYDFDLDSDNVNDFMEVLKDKTYNLKGISYHGYSNENPLEINLSRVDGVYSLTIDNINDFEQLVDNSSFIFDSVNVYKLDDTVSKLYNTFVGNGINGFKFTKNELGKFTGGLLSLLKDNIKLADNITEITVQGKPEAKLYFDFHYDDIECKVELKYGDKEINYFSFDNTIVRDTEYESKIIQRLSEYGFDSKLILNDIDLIGDFLDKGIFEISEDYEVFTSQKMKDTKLLKKNQNSVMFSIGQDNILSYNFNLDGIDSKELSSVLSSLKAKKHYHRLKSGDIVDLNDENVRELGNLVDTLDLSNKDMAMGFGTIPKYKALYLDSLKDNYKMIGTDSNFDKLIKKFNAYKDVDINLSDKELSILRDYQVTGVKWLYNIYKSGFGGILADEMGLGKSIQLIYLCKLIVKENPKAKILIVAPTSLVYNWKKEFDKFGSELNYKVFAENKLQRLNELDNVSSNVLITTYGLVRNDLSKYQEMNFDLIAIDEAQNIKNSNTGISKALKSLKSDTKFALTGTPIENSVMELWSIFEFIMPGYLANKEKFSSIYNVSNIEEISNRLNTQIKYFILRRKKRDVVKDLPDKLENNIYIELGTEQKKIYMAEVEKTREAIDEIVKTEGMNKARFKILQLLTRLRQICISPSLAFDNYKGSSAKIDELIKIVKETKENGHKILLFTTYKKALDMVLPKLEKEGISCYYIDGSVSSKKRMELVESFNKDSTDVFIITLKAGGTGLNLTSATVVIHLDLWWNPQVENQATDRAHRIGQKNTVEVIRLITKGTIEERILELQNKKRKLAEMLIDNGENSSNQFSKLTEKDIKMLLSMDNEK